MNILDMILRRLMGRAINRGIGAGIDHFAGGGKPRETMTREERQQAREAKQNVRRARQAARLARRMMR